MAINAKLTAVGILCILALSSLMYYAASQLKLKKENSTEQSNDTLPKTAVDVAVTTSNGNIVKSGGDHDRIMKISSEYLELLRNSVTNRIFNAYNKIIDGSNMPPDANAASMAGIRRIDHYAALVAQAITDRIPGDIIETGVWRGGASFVATKVLDLLNEKNRIVYLCDSFSGIPEFKNAKHASDREAHEWGILNKNSVEQVERDALMFGLKKEYMRFVKGYFNESLPAIIEKKPSVKFAVARFDGDTYDSTMQALQTLYPHISPGGYVIVDDYSDWISCREAVDEYRSMHNITTPMVLIPYAKGEIARGVYWIKEPLRSSKTCVGDGLDAQGKMMSLRVRGSYSPSRLLRMPEDGPPGVEILQLKGRKDLMMCQ